MPKEYEKGLDFSDPNDPHAREVAMIPPGSRVLDFGCWKGDTARALKEKGCRITGIEIDPDAAREAEAACERVIVADLDTIELSEVLGGEQFDVCLFGDVLEHLKSPQRLLLQARGLLAPGGFVVVSVPNIEHASIRLRMLKGDFAYEETGILDDTHLRFYTRRSIADLLESCGYMVEAMDWSEQRVAEEQLREALDPLGMGNLEEVLRAFSSWEAVAFQFIVKAFVAGEEEQVQRLSEEKVEAERRLKVLERENAEYEKMADEYERVKGELEKRESKVAEWSGLVKRSEGELKRSGDYARELEKVISEKNDYIARLEEEIASRDARIQQLESAPPADEGRRGRRR